MADEVISIDIEVQSIKTDSGDLQKQIEQIERDFASNTGDFFNLSPNAKEAFTPFVETLRSQMDSVFRNLNTTELTTSMTSGLRSSLGLISSTIDAVKKSVSELSAVFESIPAGMTNSFERSLGDMTRAAQEILGDISKRGLGPGTLSSFTKTLSTNKVFAPAFEAMAKQYGLSPDVSNKLLSSVARRVVPSVYNADMLRTAVKASGGTMKRVNLLPELDDFRERLPMRYRQLPLNAVTASESDYLNDPKYHGTVSHKDYNKIKQTAANNNAFEQALIMAGVARRTHGKYGKQDRAGLLEMPKQPITKLQYAQALGYMFSQELIPALEGSPAYYRPITATASRDQRALAYKNSSVPSEVYSAAEALDTINVDPIVLPMRTGKGIEEKAFQAGSVVVSADAKKTRPNTYQIMSLTYDDLISGKVLDAKGEIQNIYDKYPKGRSVNKQVQQSLYTDLIGMYGNLSNGSGGKTNISNPRMLQLDVSDRIFEHDAAGDMIFEDGKPRQNAEAKTLLANLFKPTESYKYQREGKEETYKYPVINYGKNGRYVPTNIKDGRIFLSEETAFLNASTPFLEKYGVNIFDNFAQVGAEYPTVEALSKVIEARNRLLTPGVPISSLGGRMPEENKIAFVNMKALTGHDGSAFFMPGYIPGGAATIRAPGVKGLAQTVDYKKMIRDLYGEDVNSFMLPGLNAPDAVVDLFKKSGYDGVVAAKDSEGNPLYSQDDINQYFVDIMQHDALMSDSILKTPFYRGKSQDVAQSFFADTLRLTGGLRVVKTANEFWAKQNTLSRQVSQNLQMTPEELQENQANWLNHIHRLKHDPDYAISQLFSDPTEPLSRDVRANKAMLFESPVARDRLQNAIDAAQLSQLNNEIYADGMLAMGLALANPAESILAIGKMNGLQIKNTKLANDLSLGENGIAAPTWENTENMGALRFPNNQAEQFLLNNSRNYLQLLSKYGMDTQGVYLDTKTIAKMGGGDFDGDTVQLIQGRLKDIVDRTQRERSAAIGPARSVDDLRDAPIAINRSALPEDFADIAYRQSMASFKMGAISNTNDALTQIDWTDPVWLKQYAKAAVDLKAMYDIDSTFAKTSVLSKWTSAATNARNLGLPFVSLFKGLQGIADNPNKESFERLGDFSKVNFPSRYDGLTASMLSALATNPMSNGAVKMLIDSQDAIQGLSELEASGDPLSEAQASFMRLNNSMMAQILTKGAIPSTETVADLRARLVNWGSAINEYEGSPETIAQQRKLYNKQLDRIGRLEQFGIHQQANEDGQGYAGAGFFKNSPYVDQASVFEGEFKKANDAWNARMAITTGANPLAVEMTKSAGVRAALANSIKQAKDFTYSKSMLDQFVEHPEEWYEDRVIGPKKDRENVYGLFGSAIHNVVQEWGGNRLDKKLKTADEYEALLDKELHSGALKDLLYNDTGDIVPVMKDRVDYARRFVRNLPNFLADEEILGVEIPTVPNFGDGRKSIGKIDIVSRNKNGEIIYTDLKPRVNYEAEDQLNLYNPANVAPVYTETGRLKNYEGKPGEGRPAQKARVASYGAASYSNPNEYLRTWDYSESSAQQSEKKYTGYADDVERWAARGFNPEEIRLGTYRTMPSTSNGVREDLMRPKAVAYNGIAREENLDARQSGYEARALIDGKTGRGIAKGIALQQDLDKYIDELLGMGGSLRGMAFRKENPGLSNQWTNYEYKLNEAFNKKIAEFRGQGATELDLKEISNARDAANAQFNTALETSASQDIFALNEKLRKSMSGEEANTTAKQYVKDFEELTASVAKATQAYDLFKQKVAKGEAKPEKLEAAESAKQELSKLQTEREEQLRKNAQVSFKQELRDLEHIASGTSYTPEEISKVKSSKLTKQIDAYKAGIQLAMNEGGFDKEVGQALLAKASAIDVGAYEKKIADQEKYNEELRLAREARRTERLYNRTKKIMRDPFGTRSNDSISRAIYRRDTAAEQMDDTIEAIKVDVAKKERDLSTKKAGSEEYKQLNTELEQAKKNLTEAEAAAARLSGTGGAVRAAFAGFGESVERVMKQFGRQLFHQAMREAKRFVVEYDQAMTEIQMVTMKTDAEIRALGDSLIDTAIEMKVPVSDVTSAAINLYRQGLGDEDVDVRMQDVIKFSKVANIKPEEASKIITTAMSNGLVNSSEEAMDALVALGDAAATSAEEISKGMKKSAASAKEAGVSYDQLVTMLTIITSKTQLGGAQAGTALQTMMYRLYRMGSGEDVYDENGNRIFTSKTTEALGRLGVNIFDDTGSFRGAYDILVDLSKQWEGASDIDRAAILDTLGAGRQRSNIATLIQGLAEDDGALADKYLGLVNSSDGITDEKYLAYLDSLNAALSEVTASFDALIASLEATGAATGFLNFISDILQGLATATELTNGFSVVLLALVPAIAAVGAAMASASGAMMMNPMMAAIAALGATVMLIGGLGNIGKKEPVEDPSKKINERMKAATDRRDETNALISRIEELQKKTSLTNDETEELISSQNRLSSILGGASSSVDGATESMKHYADSLKEASEKVNLLAEAEAKAVAVGSINETINSAKGNLLEEHNENSDNAKKFREAIYGNKTGFARDENDAIRYSIFGYPEGAINQYANTLAPNGFYNYAMSHSAVDSILEKYRADGYILDANDFKQFLYNDNSKQYSDYVSNNGEFVGGLLGITSNRYGSYRSVADNLRDEVYKILPTVYDEWVKNNASTGQNISTLQSNIKSTVLSFLAAASIPAEEKIKFATLYSEQIGKNMQVSDDYKSTYSAAISGLPYLLWNEDDGYDYDYISQFNENNSKQWQVQIPNQEPLTNLSKNEARENVKTMLGAEEVLAYDINGKLYATEEEARSALAKEAFPDDENISYVTKNFSHIAASGNLGQYVQDYQVSLPDPIEAIRYEGKLYSPDAFNEEIEENIVKQPKQSVAEKSSSRKTYDAMRYGLNTDKTENSMAYEADNLLEAMFANGISSFSSMLEVIERDKLPSIENILSNPEIAKEFNKYVAYNEDADTWTVNKGATPEAFASFLSTIASGSNSYRQSQYMSGTQKAMLANQAIAGFNNGESLDNYNTDGLRELVGDELFAKMSSRDAKTASMASTLAKEWGLNYVEALTTASTNYLSFREQNHLNTLSTNALYGINGLTEGQQLGYQTDLLSMIQSGNVSSLDETLRSVYAGGNANLSALMSASLALENEGLSFDNLDSGTEGYEDAVAVLEKFSMTAEQAKAMLADLNKEMSSASVRASKKYGDATEAVADNMDQWAGDAKSVAAAQRELNQTLTKAANNQWYRQQYRNGDRSSDVLDQIAGQTNLDKEYIKEHKDEVLEMLNIMEKEDIALVQEELSAFDSYLASQDFTVHLPNIQAAGGSVDLSAAAGSMSGEAASEMQRIASMLETYGVQAHVEIDSTGEKLSAKIVVDKVSGLGAGRKSGGGGGGGGGGKKSAAEKLLEDQSHEQTLRDHIIKMIQFEETRYENAGELTNYGIMLQHEIDEERRQVKAKEANIEALKKQIAATEKYSDDWYSLRDAIMEAEEALSDMNNTIKENEKKLKENQQAILKLHTDLEQEVKGQIETRIDEERTMLDGTVSMQETILEAIRNRYEKEWELMQKDIDKKRDALEEEIALIDERLERRKNAEDEAEKYEELAEYKRQLALISTDSTRTKDQATLREKIAELEKEIAWDVAEDEAKAQKESLQDQIDAYDAYVEDYQEYLDDLLENANNFADEVNSVMKMSHDEMIKWLEDNVEAYGNSLEAAQQQMTQGWDDMFKQMKGIVDTFWAEIAKTLSSKDSFLTYMKESSAYLNASEDERKQMEYTWGTMYDDWIAAQKVSQEAVNYEHSDDYATSNGDSSGAQNAKAKQYRVTYKGTLSNGSVGSGSGIGSSPEAARRIAEQYAAKKNWANEDGQNPLFSKAVAFKRGGLVDFTGPAWVDGTKSNPEAFLSAEDTQMIRTMIDGWKYIVKRPTVTNVDGLISGGNAGNTIGDVYVTLNEAQFNTDEDYEIVAQKVGAAFTKELAKNGFTTASYAF